MATLTATATIVTGLLRRSDLTAEAKTEIGNAIRHYSRRNTWVIEHRGGTITTSAGTNWYSTIDLTASGHNAIDDGYTGTDPTSTTDLDQMLKMEFAKIEDGSVDWPLERVAYRPFERMLEGTAVQGTPSYITLHAGQIGLWPTPGSAFTVYISGMFKPLVPSSDTDESVWLDKYNELIELSAARRLASKHMQDTEAAEMYARLEAEQELLLVAENSARRTRGVLRSTF